MQGLGIEPSSYALQAYAGITRLAHPAIKVAYYWSLVLGSNQGPLRYQHIALPTAPTKEDKIVLQIKFRSLVIYFHSLARLSMLREHNVSAQILTPLLRSHYITRLKSYILS